MFRSAVRLTPNFFIPIFTRRNENDYNTLQKQYSNTPQAETGISRVKGMFTRNEFDEVSVELTNVIQSSLCGAFIGACLGGFAKSKDAYVHFIENNQATIFKSTIEAKKKLQDKVTVAFASGAYHWGWRLGFFTGTFSLISTVIQVYHGDTSLTDYIAAGAITGAVYKANLGLAASLVGAGLGAVLSAIGGMAILGVLKATGVSIDDIRKALYTVKEAREDQFYQAVEKASEIKNDELTRHHDLLVSEKGEKKVEELP